ncbi:MAG TPA: galactokinase, partial [Bryobacteraceae bacterium]|nr:galactokinase [Bryobacteraceae bacterium]
RMLRVYSANLDQGHEFSVPHVLDARTRGDWTDYVVGVAQQLARRGYTLDGINLVIHSTVPVGSGLSSSAAIEVATALALLAGRSIDKTELASLCQTAEREFVGMPCGIMDQYVCLHGAPGAAVRIDCRSVTHELVRLPEQVSVIAVNSMVKHELSGSAYRDRVRECTEAVAAIRQRRPDVQSLRDVRSAELGQFRRAIPEIPWRRARHVTTENERVEQFRAASDRLDLVLMGKLFIASHRSLQHDYQVSCPELDFLVDTALALDGVYGARMTGGGFGGCTVNLVRTDAVDTFAERIRAEYRRKYAIEAPVYRCIPAAGACELT